MALSTAPVTPNTASSDALRLYNALPQYIRDWDASNINVAMNPDGPYALLNWVNGVCSMLQSVDDWIRDNPTAIITNVVGSGTTVTYYCVNHFSAGQIVTVQGVSPSVYDVNQATITSVGADPVLGQYFTISSAATGTFNQQDQNGYAYVFNNVGWSKIFNYQLYQNVTTQDQANRALVVLPWLAQFVGTSLPEIPYSILNPTNPSTFVSGIQPYINNWIQIIAASNNFQRGTLSWFLNSIALLIMAVNPSAGTVTTTSFTVLENINVRSYPSLSYYTDPYSVVVLVPLSYVPNQSYATFSSQTYSAFNSAYASYAVIPNTTITVQTYLSNNTPAGLNVTLLTA